MMSQFIGGCVFVIELDITKSLRFVPESDLKEHGWFIRPYENCIYDPKAHTIVFCDNCAGNCPHVMIGRKYVGHKLCAVLLCKNCFEEMQTLGINKEKIDEYRISLRR